jgi:hypothetical protein
VRVCRVWVCYFISLFPDTCDPTADKNADKNASRRFQEISTAYRVLSAGEEEEEEEVWDEDMPIPPFFHFFGGNGFFFDTHSPSAYGDSGGRESSGEDSEEALPIARSQTLTHGSGEHKHESDGSGSTSNHEPNLDDILATMFFQRMMGKRKGKAKGKALSAPAAAAPAVAHSLSHTDSIPSSSPSSLPRPTHKRTHSKPTTTPHKHSDATLPSQGSGGRSGGVQTGKAKGYSGPYGSKPWEREAPEAGPVVPQIPPETMSTPRYCRACVCVYVYEACVCCDCVLYVVCICIHCIQHLYHTHTHINPHVHTPRLGDASLLTFNTCPVEWDTAVCDGPPVEAYTLQIRVKKVFGFDQWQLVYKGTDTNYVVCGLLPGCSYQFRIRPENSVGHAEWFSYVLTCKTPGKCSTALLKKHPVVLSNLEIEQRAARQEAGRIKDEEEARRKAQKKLEKKEKKERKAAAAAAERKRLAEVEALARSHAGKRGKGNKGNSSSSSSTSSGNSGKSSSSSSSSSSSNKPSSSSSSSSSSRGGGSPWQDDSDDPDDNRRPPPNTKHSHDTNNPFMYVCLCVCECVCVCVCVHVSTSAIDSIYLSHTHPRYLNEANEDESSTSREANDAKLSKSARKKKNRAAKKKAKAQSQQGGHHSVPKSTNGNPLLTTPVHHSTQQQTQPVDQYIPDFTAVANRCVHS